MELIVSINGDTCCIYDEAIDLAALGKLSIRRASHVEPTDDGHWRADMSPVGGPMFGPFSRRSEALDAERVWLKLNWLSQAK